MIARHLLWHVGVAAVAVVALTAVGVPLVSALPVGLMAGCLAMLFHGGHGGHGHPSSRDRATVGRREAERP
jgi:hypothetical protein